MAVKSYMSGYQTKKKRLLTSVAKMAQGAKKFKAQRPGIPKKHHNSKLKGPKKGGISVVLAGAVW